MSYFQAIKPHNVKLDRPIGALETIKFCENQGQKAVGESDIEAVFVLGNMAWFTPYVIVFSLISKQNINQKKISVLIHWILI